MWPFASFGNILREIWSSIGTTFSRVFIIILVIDLILLIVFGIGIYYTQWLLKSIGNEFNRKMDDLYYQVSLLLYNNRDSIHEFPNTINYLLNYKTNLIKQGKDAHYYKDYNKLKKEINYIWDLVNTPIQYDQDLDSKHSSIVSLTAIHKQLKTMLALCSLWISTLFI